MSKTNKVSTETVTLTACRKKLASLTNKSNILDTKLGHLAWQKGKVLKQVKDICLEKGVKFEDFCAELKLKRSTAYLWIRIFEKYTEEQAKQKTLTELRDGATEKSSSSKPKAKNTATIRITKQDITRLPQDLEAISKSLKSAAALPTASSLEEEEGGPVELYSNCVSHLHSIVESANQCIEEYEQRIGDLQTREQIAESKGLNLSDSREAA